MSKKCTCEICKLSNLRTQALESRNIDFIKETLIKFADLWMHADDDRCYYKCILDGQWPQGKEILLKSLEKYKD